MVTMRPASSDAWITPAAIDEKYGSSTSATTSAVVLVEPRAIACADRWGS
jgi:hypothetical protein